MKKLKLYIFKFCTLMLLVLVLTGCKKEAIDVTEGEKSLTEESGVLEETEPSIDGEETVTEEYYGCISYELKGENRYNDSGKEILCYEYPVFSSSDSTYDSVVSSINKIYVDMMAEDLGPGEYSMMGYADEDNVCSIGISIDLTENDDYIFIGVYRSYFIGGAYPNNVTEGYAIDKSTKELAKLSDVTVLNEERLEEIVDSVYKEHSDDVNYTDLDNGIRKALYQDYYRWRIEENELVIWFENYSVGGSHGDGNYVARVPLEPKKEEYYGCISYKVKSEKWKCDYKGEPEIYAYPVFSSSDSAYDSVVESINKIIEDKKEEKFKEKEYSRVDNTSEDNEGEQDVVIEITEDKKYIVLGIYNWFDRTSEVYTIDKKKKELIKLTDVITLDETKIKEIVDSVYKVHVHDVEYDTLKDGVTESLNKGNYEWKLEGDNVVIWFEPYDVGGCLGEKSYFAEIPCN